jgi:hypothetical protein
MVPFGEWVYFFMVKVHDPEFRALWHRFFSRPPRVKKLRYQVKSSPGVQNRLALARGLHDEGEYAEAAEILRKILKGDPNSKEALHVLAICLEELDDQDGAIGILEKLASLDLVYADYEPARSLARLYGTQQRQEERLALLRTLVAKSPRLGHTVELATCLIETDQRQEAKAVLGQAPGDFDNAPGYVRRKDRPDAKAARSLWREQFSKEPA